MSSKVTQHTAKPVATATANIRSNGQPEYEYQRLVSPGSTHVARANALLPKMIEFRNWTALAVFMGFFPLMSLLGGQDDLPLQASKVNDAVVNSWIVAADQGLRVTSSMTDKVTSAADYRDFIAKVLSKPSMLGPEGKVAAGGFACSPVDSPSESWLNPRTSLPDVPRCKVSGGSTYVMSYVFDGKAVRPVMGVFHREAGFINYHNVVINDEFKRAGFTVTDRPSVTLLQIQDDINQAFPGVISSTQLKKAGALSQIKSALFTR